MSIENWELNYMHQWNKSRMVRHSNENVKVTVKSRLFQVLFISSLVYHKSSVSFISSFTLPSTPHYFTVTWRSEERSEERRRVGARCIQLVWQLRQWWEPLATWNKQDCRFGILEINETWLYLSLFPFTARVQRKFIHFISLYYISFYFTFFSVYKPDKFKKFSWLFATKIWKYKKIDNREVSHEAMEN